VPFAEVRAKIEQARRGGLDNVVLVGYGEQSLCPHTPAILDFAHKVGMATSMITNGATWLSRFKGFFTQGLDHLHISSHGLNGTLDTIVGQLGAFARQAELKSWLKSEGLPFRTNVTVQLENYQELPELAAYEQSMGVYHFVFLGFLPHYGWHNHVREIAVHPAELRPYIEDAADVLIGKGTLFTIRYHPFCHLAPRYWPYVVNARYVFF
jgi:MoaA/NifB/PqqE/SkfB family radical SAM enzyme